MYSVYLSLLIYAYEALSSNYDYCVVTVPKDSNMTWDDVMPYVLNKVGSIGVNENCKAVFVPLCYSSKNFYGDVILPGASETRLYDLQSKEITQPRVYYRFLLKTDREVTGRTNYDLNGNKLTVGNKASEIHQLAFQHLKYLQQRFDTCNLPSNMPNKIQVPNLQFLNPR